MSKTLKQLTETTTVETDDITNIVDIANDQDKKIKMANLWSGKPYGELSLYENATATAIAVATTPVFITTGGLTTLAGLLNDFTHDAATGKLTYTGTEDITVLIGFSATLQSVSGTIGSKMFINYNTTNQTKSKKEYLLVVTTWLSIASSMMLTLSNGDTIQLQVTNETSTANILIQDLNLNIQCI